MKFNFDLVQKAIGTLIVGLGFTELREGIARTPERVAHAWLEWTRGYDADAAELIKTFEDGAEGYDQMVLLKSIPVYSHCEHHLAPIFGVAHVAYIPDKKIIGLSKIPRIVDIFARRLQVQERMTAQIADALNDGLKPLGVGVVINARHFCMESRGVHRQGISTVTSALRGVMLTNGDARREFLSLAQ